LPGPAKKREKRAGGPGAGLLYERVVSLGGAGPPKGGGGGFELSPVGFPPGPIRFNAKLASLRALGASAPCFLQTDGSGPLWLNR